MKATLVIPPQSEGPSPNLGVLYLASAIRENHNTTIIDLSYIAKEKQESLTAEDLINPIINSNPEIILITTMCDNYHFVLGLAKILKEKLDVKIILGGPHASLVYSETLKAFPWIDIIVIGEAEITIKELLDSIENDISKIKGIAYKDKVTEQRPLIQNLDNIKFPSFDLINPLKDYHNLRYGQRPIKLTGKIISSRGCPFQCSYCSTCVMWQKKTRYRSITNIIKEIKELKEKYEIRHISFMDDIFTLDEKRVLDFCKQIKQANLDITWGCSSRIDTVNAHMLESMQDSGCKEIYYGVESGSPRTLLFFGKGGSSYPLKAFEIVKKTTELGINATASFIIGSPDETEVDIMMTKELAEKMAKSGAETQGHILAVLPGTKLYNEYINKIKYTGTISNNSYFGLKQEIEDKICPQKIEWIKKYPKIFSHMYSLQTKIPVEKLKQTEEYITKLEKTSQKRKLKVNLDNNDFSYDFSVG